MKRIAILFLSVMFAVSLFADVNVYSDASVETANVLADVDNLIRQNKYDSAFEKLQSADEDEYIICKKVEVCTNYFVQSLFHKLFAFKDLADGENLNDLRMKGGEFKLNQFDPEQVISDYEKLHGKIPLLEKALGDYYCDIVYRYPGNWFLPTNEVAAKSIEHYENAIKKMTLDSVSYCHLGEMYFMLGENDKAIKYLEDAKKDLHDYYLIYKNLLSLYLQKNEISKADENADCLFSLAPGNPSAGRMVVNEYVQYGKTAELQKFFERNLKRYKKENLVMANLYFYYMDFYINANDSKNTKKYARLAKEYFEKAGAYNNSLESILSPYLR